MLIKSDYAPLSATLGRHKTKIVSEPKGRPQTLKRPMIDASAYLPGQGARGPNLSFTDMLKTLPYNERDVPYLAGSFTIYRSEAPTEHSVALAEDSTNMEHLQL